MHASFLSRSDHHNPTSSIISASYGLFTHSTLCSLRFYAHKCLQGGNGAIANITPDDILGLSFILPQNESLVVELLKNFDEKLDIEGALLIKMQRMRQYLLSQMFI